MKTATTRRAVMAGLAAAPVAGLPAIAGGIGDDPVFAALAERDHAHAIWEAASAALEARQAALEVAPESSAEEASDDAFDVFGDAERAVFEASPTTKAGAVALLRFTAEFLEELGINDTKVEDVLPDAIRNAADVLERETLA